MLSELACARARLSSGRAQEDNSYCKRSLTLFAVILHHKLLAVLRTTPMAVLPPENVILRSFLQSGIDNEHPRTNHTAQAHEFDDCRYSMKRHAASDFNYYSMHMTSSDNFWYQQVTGRA